MRRGERPGMQIFENTFMLQTHAQTALKSFRPDSGEHFCFFDIETTGLSPNVSSLYLIGVLWYDASSETAHTKQWFADDYISEKDILTAFSDFLSDFTTVIHYNGSGFDIPYIEKKCNALGLPSPFLNIQSLDIFREIRTLKALFDVPNLKLSTVEKLVGFMREDHLSGKDCIQVYSDFMQKKHFRDNQMEQERQKLLLHNREDIVGTYLSAQLLAYRCHYTLQRIEESDHTVHAIFSFSGTFPLSLEGKATDCGKHATPATDKEQSVPSYTVHFTGSHIQLDIPLLKKELFHFFKNYKEYFYLPAEDTAVHKSVGIYVDKSFREPAKASNCYIKKEGFFLPLPTGLTCEQNILFRISYKSRQHYLLWDEKTKQDSSLMEQILNIVMSSSHFKPFRH